MGHSQITTAQRQAMGSAASAEDGLISSPLAESHVKKCDTARRTNDD